MDREATTPIKKQKGTEKNLEAWNKDIKELLGKVEGATDLIRSFILQTVSLSFREIHASVLCELLALDTAALQR